MSDPGVDIFNSAKPQSGEFFAFKNIGDQVQGTYIDSREGIDSYGNPQKIYVLSDAQGKIWNVGFKLTAEITHERMKGIRFGQIIGYKFEESRPNKIPGRHPTKIIRIYADPKFVDQAWLDQQKVIEARYAAAGSSIGAPQPAEGDGFEETELGSDVAPVTGGPTEVASSPAPATGDPLTAIRTLAKSKGLAPANASDAEVDAAVEAYTGLAVSEANITHIIIKLASYSK